MRYSDVKQSASRNHNIKDSKNETPIVQPSEIEYEAMETDVEAQMTVDYDVTMDTNPAYQCDVIMDTNPAYQATS